MEDRSPLPAGGAGDPKRVTSGVKVEQDTDARLAREEGASAIPIRVKKEDITDVPLKVPRFQYVNFPSLHQCIQQLTVPPLDNWLEGCPLARPSGRTPGVTSKERVPKFKYVDYPSLHHCIQQLSVPPLESWSSGLAQPGSGGSGTTGARERLESTSQPSSVKESQMGKQENTSASAAHKRDKYTAFPFPGPDPGSLQCVAISNLAPHKPLLPVRLSSPPRAKPSVSSHGDGRVLHNTMMMMGPDRLSRKSPRPKPCVAGTKRDKGGEPRGQSDRKSAGEGVAVDSAPLGGGSPRPCRQAPVELSDSPDLGRGFWRTVPEAVCPFCQKMFSDPEELRIHQRSHREKKPH